MAVVGHHDRRSPTCCDHDVVGCDGKTLYTKGFDEFTFGFVAEIYPPGSISAATFNGNTLTLEYFDHDKMGTFTR